MTYDEEKKVADIIVSLSNHISTLADRAEAAEAEVKRLKAERLYIIGFNDGWEAAVGEPPEDTSALASTGGEHHGN